MNRKLQVWLIFVGVFLAGAVAGGVISVRIAKKHVLQKVSDQLMNRRLLDRLDLTPEQKAKSEQIYGPLGKRMAESRREFAAEQQRAEQSLRAILNPEQLKRYEEYRANHREREQRLQEYRKKRDEARKNPGQPPPPAKP